MSEYSIRKGLTTIVTGGGKKLGATIAFEFARQGADVVIFDRSVNEESNPVMEAIREAGGSCISVQGDVASEPDVERVFARAIEAFGRIDIIVHTTGPWTDVGLIELESVDWDRVMNSNLKGAFLISKLAYPYLKQSGRGRIIHISADSSQVRNHTVYGLAKNGINHLTQTLALEMAPEVTVNAVAPGLLDVAEIGETHLRYARANTPLGRLVSYEDVSSMVMLMCSSVFDMVTGQTLVMDGGRTIPRYNHYPSE